MSSVVAGVIPFDDPGPPGGRSGFRLVAVAYNTKTRRDSLPWACPTEGLSWHPHIAVAQWAAEHSNKACVFHSFSIAAAFEARADSSNPAIFRASSWDSTRHPTIAQVRVTATSLLFAHPLRLSPTKAKLLNVRLHGLWHLLQETATAVGTCDRFARMLGRYAGSLDTCRRPSADSPCLMADTYSHDSSLFLQLRLRLTLIRAIQTAGSWDSWSTSVDWQRDAAQLASCSQPLCIGCRDWLRFSSSHA
mmetsp:Transcript_4130/g.10015  ORF Transcript_4130/g.10015 Transcript_4130/m.10015 type:complete len:248 (+) Transcript_4130:703-1446(+)